MKWCLYNGMCISRDMTRMPVVLFGRVYIDVSRLVNRPTVQTEIKSTHRRPRTFLFSFYYIYAFLPSISFSHSSAAQVCPLNSSSIPLALLDLVIC